MAKSASKSLKAALKSQQSRFKTKEKQAQAAQAAEQRGKKGSGRKQPAPFDAAPGSSKLTGKGKGKATGTQRTSKPVIPFRPTDRILLIGEGNFSFAHALVHELPSGHPLEHLPANNITATAYDSEKECYQKYPESEGIVERLKARGVEVLFGIDGTRLERMSPLKGRNWDKIMWNFPHAGKGITDQDRNILANQMLVMGFLRSASHMLVSGPVPSVTNPRKKKRPSDEDDKADMSDGGLSEKDPEDSIPTDSRKTRGTLLITLRNVPPYTLWDVPRLAKNPPPPLTSTSTPPNPNYILLRSFAFHRTMWKGYEHRMTKGERAGGAGTTGEGGEDRTWEFCLRD